MKFEEAVRKLNAKQYRSRKERLAEWHKLQKQLDHDPKEHSYVTCPVCGTYLDWAWCPSCKSGV